MEKSIPLEHPLDGAEARVRRAKQLLGTLKRQVRRWAELHRQLVTVAQMPDGSLAWDLSPTDGKELTRASVTMDEIAYNLRSALDYCVYVLARIGAGKIVDGTQFPIEDRPEGFDKRRNTYLKGVPADAVRLIEQMQPYAGVWWSKDLRDLSNPGKHRHLANLISRFRPTNVDTEITGIDSDAGLHTMTVRYDGEISVFYEDGRDVLDVLTALHEIGRAHV